MVMFTMAGDGSAGWRLPSWLDVLPVTSVMLPGSSVMVRVRAAEVEGSIASSSTAPALQEAHLRVYVQPVVHAGTGQLNSLQQGVPALLVKVSHSSH